VTARGGTTKLSCFAVTAPGIASLCASELAALGVTHKGPETGGVAFDGTMRDLQRANLWLRTASRVIVRVGEFGARGFPELERQAKRLPWEEFISPGSQLSLHVSSRKSKLYHSGAIAERLGDAIAKRTGVASATSPPNPAATDEGGEPESTAAQMVIVRFADDRCLVSVDSSGALLHRRGYRLASTKAPVRETLGAALLLASGWDGAVALVDPFCGSGTIPIEAAMIARRIAPGIAREFAFMHWPGWNPESWDALVSAARMEELPRAPHEIRASDRDAGAIESARANAERARVTQSIEIERLAVSEVQAPAAIGQIFTNPPYGVRVGEAGSLRNLYARVGTLARSRFSGWQITILSADDRLARATELPLVELFRTRNGGLSVRALASTPALEASGALRAPRSPAS